MARRSKIPVEFYQQMLSQGRCREGMLVIRLKAECGPCIPKGRYDTRLLKRCFNLGLLAQSRRGRYWQLPWAEICKGYQSITYAYLDHDHLNKIDFKVLAYCVATQYLTRIHDDGGQPDGKRPLKGRTIKPSVHSGGLANSIVGEFLGRSKQWASGMRKLADKAGVLSFERRSVKLDGLYVDKHQELPPGHCRNADGSVWREVASRVVVRRTYWFTVPTILRKGVKHV